jgi:hypothetical protein
MRLVWGPALLRRDGRRARDPEVVAGDDLRDALKRHGLGPSYDLNAIVNRPEILGGLIA